MYLRLGSRRVPPHVYRIVESCDIPGQKLIFCFARIGHGGTARCSTAQLLLVSCMARLSEGAVCLPGSQTSLPRFPVPTCCCVDNYVGHGVI